MPTLITCLMTVVLWILKRWQHPYPKSITMTTFTNFNTKLSRFWKLNAQKRKELSTLKNASRFTPGFCLSSRTTNSWTRSLNFRKRLSLRTRCSWETLNWHPFCSGPRLIRRHWNMVTRSPMPRSYGHSWVHRRESIIATSRKHISTSYRFLPAILNAKIKLSKSTENSCTIISKTRKRTPSGWQIKWKFWKV